MLNYTLEKLYEVHTIDTYYHHHHHHHHHNLLYAGKLHLYTRNNPCLQWIQCCSYSVVTIQGAYQAISNVKYYYRLFLPGTSPLKAAVIPTSQAWSFRLLQYFQYHVWSSKYSCFCSDSIQCFPGMASKFLFIPFVTVLVTPIITGIIIHFMFHIRCISVYKRSYFNFFSVSLCMIFLSARTATSIRCVFFLLCF